MFLCNSNLRLINCVIYYLELITADIKLESGAIAFVIVALWFIEAVVVVILVVAVFDLLTFD